MIKDFAKGKVAVFIDAANIFYSQRTLGWRVDYTKLKAYFERETDLVAMHLYTGKVGADEKQEKFLTKLTQLGYIVRAKEVKRIKVGPEAFEWKGNLDVELALDAYRMRNQFDTFILFSGDSDFAYLIDLLKQVNKQAIVVSMRGHIAKELIVRAKYIPLQKLRMEIEFMEKENSKGRTSRPLRSDNTILSESEPSVNANNENNSEQSPPKEKAPR